MKDARPSRGIHATHEHATHTKRDHVFRGFRTLVRFAVLLVIAALVADGATQQHVRAQAPSGKQVYDLHCAECHGTTGRGDGPSAAFLNPQPRDLTAGKYKLRSTETGNGPTDDDLIQTVRRGMYGTSMPGWDRILPDEDIKSVAAFVKSLAPQMPTAVAVTMPEPIPSSDQSIARGHLAFDKLQCAKCHGVDGRGTGAVATTFEDDWKQPLKAADLTEPWTFRGGATARDIYLRFRAGMSGTPMPSFKEAATDAEMWDLANYVVSFARKPVWSMNAQEIGAHYAQIDADAKKNPVKRGEYLVDTIGCTICHSSYDAQKRMIPHTRLAGGLVIRVEPYGDFPAGNLTPDKETGLGNWNDDEIKRTITKGILRDGTRLLPFPMDWASFSTMAPDDLNAVVTYLRSIPAVRNPVPRPTWKPFPLYMWGKFKMLVLGQDPPIIFLPTGGR
jgi:mono/diheme cytochrome c family protein